MTLKQLFRHSATPRIRRAALALALAVIALDQLSKWLMLEVVKIGARPPIAAGPFLDLVMVWNRGISFGLFAQGGGGLLLVALSLAICAFLLRWLARTPSAAVALAIGAVTGGALGNVVDRLRYGAVADFFYFHLGPYYWPAFNVADAAICIGVALLCIESMLKPHKQDSPDA